MSFIVSESVVVFGCGYVGQALCQALLKRGSKVAALTRNAEKASVLRSMGCEHVIQADLQDSGWHKELGSDYSAVVNCVSSAGGGLEGYRKSYLEGQASILEWAQSCSISRYVYTSSTSVYPQDGGAYVVETADTAEASGSGQILLQSEALLQNATQIERHYILRLAGIYGPDRHYLLDQLKSGSGSIPGCGDYHMNMIHRDDIVRAILSCLGLQPAAPSGVYNLADDAPHLKAEVMGWLADKMSLTPPEFDSENISPRLARRGGRMPDRRIGNTKAKNELSWAPEYSSFREGYAAILG